MPQTIARYDFELKIDFEKGSTDPSRVFTTMSNLIKTFEIIDFDLAKSIDISINPTLILEDIKSGSLRSLLRNTLLSIDDNGLKELNWKKIVGEYLYKGKYLILDFLEDKNEISNREQINLLQSRIQHAAIETNVRSIPGYAQIPTEKLLMGIKNISQAVQPLKKADRVEYTTLDGTVVLNKNFNYDAETIEAIFTKEVKKYTTEMMLKVKKPDYLGQSMWEFKQGDHTIQAKIIDQNWLLNFQSRAFDLRPGDSIQAIVETQNYLGYKNELLAIHYYIHEIKDIKRMYTGNGDTLNFDA